MVFRSLLGSTLKQSSGMPPKSFDFWAWLCIPNSQCSVHVVPPGHRRFVWEGRACAFLAETQVHILNKNIQDVRDAHSTHLCLFFPTQPFPKQLSSSSQPFRIIGFLEAAFPEATVFLVAAFPTCSLEAAAESGGMGPPALGHRERVALDRLRH
jgi:hypothetical protein